MNAKTVINYFLGDDAAILKIFFTRRSAIDAPGNYSHFLIETKSQKYRGEVGLLETSFDLLSPFDNGSETSPALAMENLTGKIVRGIFPPKSAPEKNHLKLNGKFYYLYKFD